jgi:hypothetical protein
MMFKKKPKVVGRTEFMTNKMNHVIQAYVNKYNSSGFIQAKNSDVIRNIAIIVTPIMQGILQKYNENDFHRVMNKTYYDESGRLCYGFDFIGDIRRNHPYAFGIAMTVVRSYKKKLNFDISIATQMVIDIMHSWGWTVTYNEQMGMRHLLYRMKRLIHNS